jgi:PD-(D/E)XK nuclease superfamily protein
MNTREQGDLGELSAMDWFVSQGAKVALPVGHSPDWDLLAEYRGRIFRVQVKTSNARRRGRWEVAICTRGGNQSWNGLVKRLDSSRYDLLFVHVGDGRRWLIASGDLEAGTHLTLGGPKYAEFEVDPGRPFNAQANQKPVSTIETP